MSGKFTAIEEKQPSAPVFAFTSQDDVEIEPLSGKPFFHVRMLKSHTKSPYNMAIPVKFISILPNKTTPVILLRGSRSWEMSYRGNQPTHKRLDSRWKVFVQDNRLNIGDICLFELMTCDDTLIKFKVQILRGDFPSVLLDKQDGTRDKPVVIDDD